MHRNIELSNRNHSNKTFCLMKSLINFTTISRPFCLVHSVSLVAERKWSRRISGQTTKCMDSAAMEILDVVEKTYVPNMQDVVIDGVKIEPPKPLPWYPDNLGWQVNAPRLVIKKSPEFQKFHRFMVTETEAVSIMI